MAKLCLFLLKNVLIIAFLALSYVSGRIHEVRLQNEKRQLIYLTTFGFLKKGSLSVNITEFEVKRGINSQFGFTLDKSVSGQFSSDDEPKCVFSDGKKNISSVLFTVDLKNNNLNLSRIGDLKNITIQYIPPDTGNETSQSSSNGENVNSSIPLTVDNKAGSVNFSTSFVVIINTDAEEGSYDLRFHNCNNDSVNATIDLREQNENNYLSAGEIPLPTMYLVLAIVYFTVASWWFCVLRKSTEGVFKIHYLMLVLVYVKSIAVFFHAVNFHFIAKDGSREEAFAILWYITYLMRGTLMFVTIVLIGAGWTFVKYILSDRDKKIFVIFIPLQILANVAQVIIEETEESQSQYRMWKQILILVDLLCCGAILFPIVWTIRNMEMAKLPEDGSIRHLQAASQTDGKAAINLAKLKTFRHFYILIVCYIYFTRIIVFLLQITLPFQYLWLTELFKEIATLIFFMVTGYKFRPSSNNPYLRVPQDDDELEMDEVVTMPPAVENLKKVNVRTSGKGPKQRESSHEYD